MKANEWLKWVSQEVARYVDTPRHVRKQRRMERKQYQEPWSVRWFGMIPLGLSMMIRPSASKKEAPPMEE